MKKIQTEKLIEIRTCPAFLTAMLVALTAISFAWSGYVALGMVMSLFANEEPGNSLLATALIALFPFATAIANAIVASTALLTFLGVTDRVGFVFRFAIAGAVCSLLWLGVSFVFKQDVFFWVIGIPCVLNIIALVIAIFQTKTFVTSRSRAKASIGFVVSLVIFLVSNASVVFAYMAGSEYTFLSAATTDSVDELPMANFIHSWITAMYPDARIIDYISSVMFCLIQIGIVGFLGFVISSILMIVFIIRVTKQNASIQ